MISTASNANVTGRYLSNWNRHPKTTNQPRIIEMMTRPFTIKELNNMELRFAKSLLTNSIIREGMKSPTMYERNQILSSLQNEFTHLTEEALSGTGIVGNVIIDFENTRINISINWMVR